MSLTRVTKKGTEAGGTEGLGPRPVITVTPTDRKTGEMGEGCLFFKAARTS